MAKHDLFRPDSVSFSDLLANGRTYSVPIYQRDYSWKEEQWGDLWEDILKSRQTGASHYMGAVVLQNQDEKKYTIIDGQQRFATLSILVLAVIKRLQDLIETGVDSEQNEERVELLRNSFLGGKDAASLSYSSKLFLNENNDTFYQVNLLQLEKPRNLNRLSFSEKLMWKAFEFFYKGIEEEFGENPNGETLAEFLTKQVAEKLLFLRIIVEDELSAYTVFETLNARGVELTVTDLLKNYLLSLFPNQSQDQKLAKEQWKRIIRITDLSDFPKFLRHYWNSRNTFVRAEKLFREVRTKVKSRDDVKRLMNDLEDNANTYAALGNPNDEFWGNDKEIRKYVRELNLFKVVQCYPLLLNAYTKFTIEDFKKVLRFCSVISFRYNVIAGLNPNAQEKAYNDAARKLYEGQISNTLQVAQALKEIYPSDEEFKNAFSTKALDTKRNKELARYTLYVLENHIAGTNTSFEDDIGTIEHILPENPTDEWIEAFVPSGSEYQKRDETERHIYRLGNLTLLENNKNNDCQRKLFEEKQKIYQTSQYQMTKQISYPAWTAEQVRSRQEYLARQATSIWRIAQLSG